MPTTDPGPGTIAYNSRGRPGPVEKFGTGECAVGGLAVRFEHHRIAGDQRGHRVRRGQRHRVVPRRDDPDHALGLVAHRGLADARQQRLHPPRREQVLGDRSVVVGVGGEVDDLLLGGPAGLTGLGLQQIHQKLAVVGHQVAVPGDDRHPVGHRPPRPRDLGRAGLFESGFHVGGGADRDGGHRAAGEDLLDGPGRTLAGVLDGHQRAQTLEDLG